MIALLSDFGLRDNYVGVMKGVIARIFPRARVVDITHQVRRHDIPEAAFLLAASFSYFPVGTIFVSVVDPGVGSSRRAIAIETRHYFFIGPDNGVSSIAAARDGVRRVVVLENKRYFLRNVSSTFHGRDIFAPVAAHLSRGVSFARLGRAIQRFHRLRVPVPLETSNTLCGRIMHVDTFGNLTTNITADAFGDFTRGEAFTATLAGKNFSQASLSYTAARPGPFFIEGSSGFLEISLARESAARYFSVKTDCRMPVRIRRLPLAKAPRA